MNASGLAWGVFFVAVGVFALLADLGVVATRPAWMWPLLLVIVGVALLVGGLLPGRRGGSRADA
ncbi:MAG TPA: hypothetical protein VK875_08815 [Euzebyales bacterium]|nr:hypothetical protein [Euzebyales bacterium]